MQFMKRFTAKEIAEKFNVDKGAAQKWIQKKLFPNAYKEKIEPFGEIWYVPAADMKNFCRPQRGRPKCTNPTPASVLKRHARAKLKENKAA